MTLPLVAGLDLAIERERHADAVALVCATTLTELGGQDVTVGTHATQLDDRRSVALVVEVAGLDETAVAAALPGVARSESGDEHALLVGDRWHGAAELRDGLQGAVGAQRTRRSGRAVVFPGSAGCPGATTVAELLASTGVDRVRVLGGATPDGTTPLRTRDFLRPRWEDGELVLHAQPASGGVLIPFESPNPTPCCAAHA